MKVVTISKVERSVAIVADGNYSSSVPLESCTSASLIVISKHILTMLRETRLFLVLLFLVVQLEAFRQHCSTPNRCATLVLPSATRLPHISSSRVVQKSNTALGFSAATVTSEVIAAIPKDLSISVAVMAETYVFLKFFTGLATKGMPVELSRKLIHTLSGPVVIAHWPLFSLASDAKYYAALIPLLQIGRLVLASRVNGKDSQIVKAVSRSGNKKEALEGPLIYMVVVLFCTMLFFRNSAIGVVAVSQMAVGDGLSDICGRRWGTVKWSFSTSKSIVGSLAFVIGAFGATVGLLYFLYSFGFTGVLGARAINGFSTDLILRILGISITCAAVESLPATVVDDNISVPVVAALSAFLLL